MYIISNLSLFQPNQSIVMLIGVNRNHCLSLCSHDQTILYIAQSDLISVGILIKNQVIGLKVNELNVHVTIYMYDE